LDKQYWAHHAHHRPPAPQYFGVLPSPPTPGGCKAQMSLEFSISMITQSFVYFSLFLEKCTYSFSWCPMQHISIELELHFMFSPCHFTHERFGTGKMETLSLFQLLILVHPIYIIHVSVFHVFLCYALSLISVCSKALRSV
jgi:hypothetical protein